MATPTDGQAAHGFLLATPISSCRGCCWHWVWRAYAQAGASTSMGSSPTAVDGWNKSLGKHPGDMNPPPGAAIWLGRRYDGNMDGDVFIAGPYDGNHAATDQPVYGVTGLTSIEARMDLCGREYLGWTDHVLDAPIILGGSQPPSPITPEEDQMEIVMTTPNGTIVRMTPRSQYDFGSLEEYNRFRGDISTFRSNASSNLMELPESQDVVRVDWDTYKRFQAYFGLPVDQ